MSVAFVSVKFQNTTGIDVIATVTIQTPPGRPPTSKAAPAQSTVSITPDSPDNCLAVSIHADDGGGHGATQDFILGSPNVGYTSYLESIDVVYSDYFDIVGTATTRTDAPHTILPAEKNKKNND